MAMKQYGTDLVLNGLGYVLENRGNNPPHQRAPLPVQEGESKQEFNLEFRNGAKGWGWSKYLSEHIYDYTDAAILYRAHSWLPGTTVHFLSPGTAPDGPVAFGEFWDGTEANRRLIAAADRYVYEIQANLTISTNDLTAVIGASGAMGKPERYKTGSIAVRMYIPVKGPTATDLFIVRTAANAYSETTSTFRAEAMGVAVDIAGDFVLWIADPDASWAGEDKGQIRQSVALADPQNVGSYATASYPVGEASVEINDIVQQNKRMLIARPDGVYTFNNVSKSVPVVGLLDALDSENGKYITDYNGTAIVPTIVGLLQIDGIQWEPVGPISSNKDAHHLRDQRELAFTSAGEYAYAATFDGVNSMIWLGTKRGEMEVSSGSGPFVWHGVIATVPAKEIAPGGMRVWTAGGKRLFLGFHDSIGYIQLNDDFSPVADAASGTIYFPEGALDAEGPAVLVEIHSVEYIGTVDRPMDSLNKWTVSFDFGEGPVSPGDGDDGVYKRVAFATERSGRRIQLQLSYVNDGTAELESFVVNGIVRPLNRWRHTFRIRGDEFPRGNIRQRIHRTPEKIGEELRALYNAGWKGVVQFGNDSFFGQVTDFSESTVTPAQRGKPAKYYEIVVDEVV